MGTASRSGESSSSAPADHPAVNEVRLRGRVSAVAEPRTLPSGDVVVALRVVVARGRPRGTSRVDVVDVACWSARTRRVAARLVEGDEVEVHGALRRRFFRTGQSTQSRYEVEADLLTRGRRRDPGRARA